jgi:hypothetical protein
MVGRRRSPQPTTAAAIRLFSLHHQQTTTDHQLGGSRAVLYWPRRFPTRRKSPCRNFSIVNGARYALSYAS